MSMTRGVYLDPAAVARNPEYAARLAAAGVSIFLLRTGFDPRRTAPALERAVAVADRLGVATWLLAGTWWGHGLDAGAEAMALPDGWRALARRGLLGDYPAHERQWPMLPPGGRADAAIAANLEHLARRWGPRAICLTHARFRHPAAIGGLFESAPGWPELAATHWEQVLAGLEGITPRRLAELSAGHDLAGALDQLARRGAGGGRGPERGVGAPFAGWFAQRGARMQAAVNGLLGAARRAGGGRLRAGVNAIAPHAAALSGQHYGELARQADFVQPLLGYLNWHVFQCGAAWARLLRRAGGGRLSEAEALAGAWRLFGLEPRRLPRSEAEMAGEGAAGTPEAVAGALLERVLRACPAQRVLPVLRGHGWPAAATRRLEQRIRAAGCPAVFYQGTTVLAGLPPGPGWE